MLGIRYNKRKQNTPIVNTEDSDTPDKNFAKHYYFETLINGWLIIAFTILIGAVLIHINLNLIIGSCIIFTSLLLIIITLIGVIFWFVYGESDIIKYIRIRRAILILKYIIISVIICLFIWAAIIMILKSTSY
jgi:hypothetical protein